jgi:site-specific recombinase XerD
MQINQPITILFWILKNRIKEGRAPLMVRITINGQRTEISANRSVLVGEWNPKAQQINGRSEESKEINNHIVGVKARLLKCSDKLELRGVPLTLDTFKNEFLGVKTKPRMLLEIFAQHNKDIFVLIGKQYSRGTWIKYQTVLKHTAEFLIWKYNLRDMDIAQLNFTFISDFEFYLKSKKNLNINTTSKCLRNFKKIVLICVANSWIPKDPFMGYKMKSKKTERGFLTPVELEALKNKCFDNERLNQVKDMFLFSCYTGLAYIDLFNLSPKSIIIGMDGGKWISIHRQKTEIASRVPLLSGAMEIIERYSQNPMVMQRQKLLPVISNQKTNAYLKEIAACSHINKELTFHMARHTFATTVTLNNGVPIESVSKMMGHTRIQTTQIYAKVLDQKVSGDMMMLRNKLEEENKKDQKLKSIG